jgi:hypothetical protein
MSPATRTNSNSSAGVPDAARQFAGRLADAFEQDQRIAEQQNACQHRLQAANGQLWSGLHPDALGLLYDDTHAVGIAEPATVRSQITAVMADARRAGAGEEEVETVVLRAVQEVHWTIHRAFSEHQRLGEDRRHLAAEIGELIAGMVAELVAAGWTEDEARTADVRALAAAGAR